MCDTIGRRISENHSIFAKNSDRSPNEPQIIEFIEHKKHTVNANVLVDHSDNEKVYQ